MASFNPVAILGAYQHMPKENGEMCICVDFVQLNRVTKKKSYTVPRADRPQQKLADKCVFSKIDLCSACWQLAMQKESIEKTVFSPGPVYTCMLTAFGEMVIGIVCI